MTGPPTATPIGIYIGFLKCYSRRLDPDIILSLVRKIAKNPKGTLEKADFEKVFVAIFSGKSITNIKPLVKLPSVSNLSLVDNEIADLKPLTILKNLVALQLQGNQISILKPVADLLLLEQLNLSRNQIKNLAPLKKLVNLERLNLINNKISNISVLSNFPKLTWLGLNFNDISKLKPLYGLKKLEVLMIKGNTQLRNGEIMDLEDQLPNCTIEY
jgi:internalin A